MKWTHLARVIRGRQRLAHRHRHEQLLRQFLLSEGDGAAGNYNAFPSLQMTFGDLLDDRGEPAEGQTVAIFPRYHSTSQLDDQPTGVLQLAAIRERRLAVLLAKRDITLFNYLQNETQL